MKLFHSWKRWQLIALVCVVLTAVLTLVFVLQGGGGDTQPTSGTEGLQLATETLENVTEPPETAAPTERPTAAPTEATEAPTEASTEATKAPEAPTRRDAACHGGPDGAARNGACRSLVHGLHLLHDGPGQLGQALGGPSVPSSRRTVSSSAP